MRDGLLLINKPSGPTSHDVVQLVRRRLAMRRVGHTGTLDPMAQGLLIVLVGAATKRQQAFQGHEKTYEALLQLGSQTDTGDADGQIVRTEAVPALGRRQVAEVLASCIGPLVQTPPRYSAVKVQGRPAYWWARRNRPLTLPTRTVQIVDIRLNAWEADTIRFHVRCSAGTYIRSLAEAIAERLGTVGHLAALTRLTIGEWTLDEAKPMVWVREASSEMLARELRPIDVTPGQTAHSIGSIH